MNKSCSSFWQLEVPSAMSFHKIQQVSWSTFILLVKFIYSVKATKYYAISTLLLSYVVPVKSQVEISKIFVAFSIYINFKGKAQFPRVPFLFWKYFNRILIFQMMIIFFIMVTNFNINLKTLQLMLKKAVSYRNVKLRRPLFSFKNFAFISRAIKVCHGKCGQKNSEISLKS